MAVLSEPARFLHADNEGDSRRAGTVVHDYARILDWN